MTKCRCPKGYPKLKETVFVSELPRAGFRFDTLLRLHAGRCRRTDELMWVKKGA